MNSNQLYIVDEKVFSQTWEREKDSHPMTTLTTGTANAAIAALAASDNYICLDADLDTYETRGTSYLRVKLYFGDTDVNPQVAPPVSNVYILCHETADAVSTDIKAYIAAGGAHLTAPKGIKSMQTVSTNYRGHKRYATLVLLTDNVGEGYKSVVSKTADFTLGVDEDYVVINPAATTDVTLPDASAVLGKTFRIMTQDVDQIINLSPSATDAINDHTVAADVNIGLGGEGAEDNREWSLTAIGANLWNLAPAAAELDRKNIVNATNAAAGTVVAGNTGLVLADANGGATVVNIPAASASLVGWEFEVSTVDITGTITLTRPGADTINGAAADLNIGSGYAGALAYRRYKVTCVGATAWNVSAHD
jgi:hypothetical protein